MKRAREHTDFPQNANCLLRNGIPGEFRESMASIQSISSIARERLSQPAFVLDRRLAQPPPQKQTSLAELPRRRGWGLQAWRSDSNRRKQMGSGLLRDHADSPASRGSSALHGSAYALQNRALPPQRTTSCKT